MTSVVLLALLAAVSWVPVNVQAYSCADWTVTSLTISGMTCEEPITGLTGSANRPNSGQTDLTCTIPESSTHVIMGATVETSTVPGYSQPDFIDFYLRDLDRNIEQSNSGLPVFYTFTETYPKFARARFTVQSTFYDEVSGNNVQCTAIWNVEVPAPAAPSPCLDKTAQQCLNRNTNLTECDWNFQSQACQADDPPADTCQGYSTQNDCDTNGCFWDPFIVNCLSSLSQVNSVFQCGFWTAYKTSQQQNDGCVYHGCKWDINAQSCIAANATLAPASTSIVTAHIQFLNESFNTETQTFTVRAVVPFEYTTSVPTDPHFPIFQVLFSVEDPSSYSSSSLPSCSSFVDGTADPVPFSTTVDPAAANTFLSQWVVSHQNLDFDSSELGLVLRQSLGRVAIGPDQIVKSVTYDGTHLHFNITVDLYNITAACGTRGVVATQLSQGLQYTIPISLVQHSKNDAYAQVTQTYFVTVPTSGSAAIGSSTSYGTEAFPLMVVIKRGEDAGCEADEARMLITWRIETYNVYSDTAYVGWGKDDELVFRSPSSPAGPVNCYGYEIDFTGTSGPACDRSSFMCYRQVRLQTRCRQIAADGDTFNKCSHAKSADRIADMGGDLPYPTALDSKHTIFFYRRICMYLGDDWDFGCTLYNEYSNGHPHEASAYIVQSVYRDQEDTASQFLVSSGFLPQQNRPLEEAIDPAITGNLQLAASDAITIFTALSPQSRNRYDLNVNTDSSVTYITALDVRGLPISGLPELSYSNIRARVLYTVKSDFNNGCGAAGTCNLLPACEGIIGCDGFSLPAAQLRSIIPADQYRITVGYTVGVPIAPAGRRLLQTSTQSAFSGRATFRITITSNNTVIISGPNGNGTLVEVDFAGAFNQADLGKTRDALLAGVLCSVATAVVVYAFLSQLVMWSNAGRK